MKLIILGASGFIEEIWLITLPRKTSLILLPCPEIAKSRIMNTQM